MDNIGSIVEEYVLLEAEFVMLECQEAGFATDAKESWLLVAMVELVLSFRVGTVAPW